MKYCFFIFFSILVFSCCIPCGRSELLYDIHQDIIRPGAKEQNGMIVNIKQLGENNPVIIIIINDSAYTIDKDTVFRTQAGGLTSINSFKPGMNVKFYVVNSLITKLWVSDQQPMNSQLIEGRREGQDDAQQIESSGKIRKEGGVWKN